MYNRYIPSGTSYTRILEQDDILTAPAAQGQSQPHTAAPPPPAPPLQSEEKKKSGLAALLKNLKLEDLDTGDLLLLLILLFLFLEGDDMELIITLGLLLVLGLD